MIRAAVYVRYSSDRQKDRSIDDQIALCRDLCAREGMAVISTFEDRAISGALFLEVPACFSSLIVVDAWPRANCTYGSLP